MEAIPRLHTTIVRMGNHLHCKMFQDMTQQVCKLMCTPIALLLNNS